MTLYTTDYLEYYLTLLAWVVNNGVWNVIADSGLFALPFAVIIIDEWVKARGEGADEGNKGVLSVSRIENRIWAAIVVLLFGCLPFFNVSLSTIKFDSSRSKQCEVNMPAPADTGWGESFTTLDGKTAKVPIWWLLVHSLSKGFNAASVAAIPCNPDLRQMRMDIDSTRINDPALAQEIADFTHDCYGRARAKFFMERPSITVDQLNDVTWIGSEYFQSKAGYYDTYHSNTPRSSWPYDKDRDAGLAQVSNGGGYPSCKQWWADTDKGLRARLLAQVEPDLLTRVGSWVGFLSKTEVDDSIIRQVVSPSQQNMTQGQVYTDYGGQVDSLGTGSVSLPNVGNYASRIAGDVGLTIGALGYFPAMDIVRQALPMIMAFLKMALVICIPPVLVLSTYNIKAAMTLTGVQFGFFFVDFWFQLARWVDSTIIDALYGWSAPHAQFNPIMGLNNTQGDMLLNFVMGAMFIVLPTFWVTAMTWAGVRAGGVLNGLAAASSDAKSAGSKGVNTVGRLVK